MDFVQANAQIDIMLRTLDEAKSYSGLGPNDPAVVELERIMLAKIAELKAAKSEGTPGDLVATASPAKSSEPSEAPASPANQPG